MPRTWISALYKYSYPVTLSKYTGRGAFPGFFTHDIGGDRASTIDFEDYFRASSDHRIEPYVEVASWKLCGRKRRFEARVNDLVDHLRGQGVTAPELRCAVNLFLEKPTKTNLMVLRALLDIKTDVLALALTFPAFVDPVRFPMVDKNTAGWVKEHHSDFSLGRAYRLTPFALNYSSLHYNDFDNYLNWVDWCRESADILTDRTDIQWRARDVEMAVFAAARQDLGLNPLT